MKRIAVFLLLVACVLALTGCKSVDYGTVIDKSFTEAHKVYRPHIMRIGGHTSIIPHWRSVPDSWNILVECDDAREWWAVQEDYYNSVQIGDYVDRR